MNADKNATEMAIRLLGGTPIKGSYRPEKNPAIRLPECTDLGKVDLVMREIAEQCGGKMYYLVLHESVGNTAKLIYQGPMGDGFNLYGKNATPDGTVREGPNLTQGFSFIIRCGESYLVIEEPGKKGYKSVSGAGQSFPGQDFIFGTLKAEMREETGFVMTWDEAKAGELQVLSMTSLGGYYKEGERPCQTIDLHSVWLVEVAGFPDNVQEVFEARTCPDEVTSIHLVTLDEYKVKCWRGNEEWVKRLDGPVPMTTRVKNGKVKVLF